VPASQRALEERMGTIPHHIQKNSYKDWTTSRGKDTFAHEGGSLKGQYDKRGDAWGRDKELTEEVLDEGIR